MIQKMSRIFTLFLCFSCAFVANSMSLNDVIAKILNLCQHKYSNLSVIDCVKERSLVVLDNVYRSKNEINIIPDFVSLTRTDNFKIEERSGKILPAELENQSPQEKSSILDNLLVSRLGDFFGSRAISVKIPISRLNFFNLIPKIEAEKEEGRGRKDRGLLPMLAMMAGSLLIFKMTAIAVIASKALMASMMAMMLSAIAAFSRRGAHGSTYEVINVPAHGHQSRRLYGDTAAYSNQYHRGESISHEPIEIENNT